MFIRSSSEFRLFIRMLLLALAAVVPLMPGRLKAQCSCSGQETDVFVTGSGSLTIGGYEIALGAYTSDVFKLYLSPDADGNIVVVYVPNEPFACGQGDLVFYKFNYGCGSIQGGVSVQEQYCNCVDILYGYETQASCSGGCPEGSIAANFNCVIPDNPLRTVHNVVPKSSEDFDPGNTQDPGGASSSGGGGSGGGGGPGGGGPGGSGGGGSSWATVPDSVKQVISLGRTVLGDPLGRISYQALLNAPTLSFDASSVVIDRATASTNVPSLVSEVYDDPGVRRQVLATASSGSTANGAVLVDMVPLDPLNPGVGFILTAYDATNVNLTGAPYSLSADRIISQVTVQKVSTTVGGVLINGIKVTTVRRGQQPEAFVLYADPAPGGTSGVSKTIHGQDVEVVTDTGYVTPPGGGADVRTVTTERFKIDAGGTEIPISSRTDTYKKILGREKLVQSAEGTGGNRITYYSYYGEGVGGENLPPMVQGKLHIQLNPDGTWARYFYNSDDGSIAATWTPWLDVGASTISGIAAISANECRVVETQKITFPAIGTSTTTRIQGFPVSRTVTTERSVHDGFTGLVVNERLSQTFASNGTLVSESRSGSTTPTEPNGPTRLVYAASLDGTRMTYEGPESGGAGTYVTTQGTVYQPGGIPRKSLQTVRIEEEDGGSSEETRVALGGGSYATVSVRTVEEEMVNGSLVTTTRQDGIIVSESTQAPNGTVTDVDVAGVTTVSSVDAETGTSTITRLGGDAITIAPYGELHDGSDLANITSTHARPPGPGGVPRGSIERVRRVTGEQSRTESETEVDEVGDTVRTTDVYGRTTSYTYGVSPTGGRIVTETGPGGVTRVSTYYLDGKLKSLTGSGVVAQYYTYEWNGAGELATTVRTGSAQSPRWRRTGTDVVGRMLREEKPAFGGNGISRTEYVYNTKGQRVKVLRTGLAAEVYEYDDAGNLFRQGIDLNGDGALNLAGSPDPITESSASYEQIGGLWWQVSQSRQYFGDGTDAAAFRKTEQRRALGLGPNQVGISIDATGRQTITTTAYDPANRTVKSASFVNEAPNTSEVVESTTVNGLNVLQTSSISGDRTTVLKFDAFERLTFQSGPAGAFTLAYDGNLDRLASRTQTTGSTNLVTSYTYFGPASACAGQVESITAPASVLSLWPATTYHEYDAMGRLTGKWGNGTYPVRYRYDGFGDRVEMWTYRTSTIDSGARPWVQGEYTPSTLASVTRWIYDMPSGLLSGKRDAVDKGASYEYGASGLLAQRTWARTVGGVPLATTFQYDGAGRLITTNYSDTTPDVTLTYYRDGTLRQVIDGAGLRTFDRLSGIGTSTRETIAGGGSGADLLEGLVVEQPVDGRGRKRAFSGRFTVPAQTSVPLPVVSYAYQDGWVGATPPGETIAWNYAGSPEMRFVRGTTYDGSSKRHKVTIERSLAGVPNFKSTTETDAAQGTVQVSHQHGSATPFQSRTRSWSFIEQVDPDITAWPTMVASHEQWSYAADMRGQIGSASKYAASTPGSAVTSPVATWSASYAYDDIGNRKSVSNGQIEYVTNALNQYTSIANTREFTVRGAAPTDTTVTVNGQSADRHGIHFFKGLQAGGNGPRSESVEVEASRTVGGTPHTAEQTGYVYVPPASEVLIYDEDGNLTSDGRWNYTWDGENRLVGMSTNSVAVTAGVPQITLVFAYDYRSRRIAKTVSKYVTAESAWRTTSDLRFVYEGWNLMAEVELLAEKAPGATGQAGVSPRLFRSFVWGPDVSGTWEGAGGVGGLFGITCHQRVGQASESYMATWDLNGNVIGLYGASGKLALYDYDAFGQVLRANEPEEDLNPFQFSTKYRDSETGFCYYGYRFYDSARGRWLNRDPIEERGGLNLYGMVKNSVPNQVDKLGNGIVTAWNVAMNKPAPWAVGLNGTAIYQIGLPDYVKHWISENFPDLSIGLGVGLYFFPDTCELAAFKLKAGLATGDKPGEKPDTDFGIIGGAAIAGDVARFVGTGQKGEASAQSFAGPAVSLGVFGSPVSLWWGVTEDELRRLSDLRRTDLISFSGTRWWGGSVGIPGAAYQVSIPASLTTWYFEVGKVLDMDAKHPILGRCACHTLALTSLAIP